MANHWVFNKDYIYNPTYRGAKGLDVSLRIKSTQAKLPIRKDEKYILIEPTYEIFNFTQYGFVEKIGPVVPIEFSAYEKEQNEIRAKKDQPLLPQQYFHPFVLKAEGEIEETRKLNDYTYSLLSVYSYLNPQKHFQQQYRKILVEDYETITKEQVFIARTAFGNLINALPKESKYDFVLYAIEEFGTVEFKGMDFIKVYKFLWEYINENILSQGRYITSAHEILGGSLSKVGVPVSQVGFISYDEDGKDVLKSDVKGQALLIPDKVGDSISIQSEYFKDLFKEIGNNKFSSAILEKITIGDKDEEYFKRIFSNKLWPVDMNV